MIVLPDPAENRPGNTGTGAAQRPQYAEQYSQNDQVGCDIKCCCGNESTDCVEDERKIDPDVVQTEEDQRGACQVTAVQHGELFGCSDDRNTHGCSNGFGDQTCLDNETSQDEVCQ